MNRAEKRDAEDLRLSYDQLSQILQSAVDGITAVSSSGRIEYLNEAAAHLLGFPHADDLLGADWSEVTSRLEAHDEAGHAVEAGNWPGARVLRGRSPVTEVLRVRRMASGDEHWLAVRASPITNGHAPADLVVSVWHDISSLKQAEVFQRLLADTARLLARALEEPGRLVEFLHLVVAHVSDWAALDVIGRDGSLQRVAVACGPAAEAAMAAGHPFELGAPFGSARAVAAGEMEDYPELAEAQPPGDSLDDRHRREIAARGLKSAIIVPLIARDHALGALSLVWAATPRRPGAGVSSTVEILGRRLSMALDNIRMFREAQEWNTSLEQRVLTRTAELVATRNRLEDEIAERRAAQMRLEASQAQLHLLSGHLQAAREEERVRLAREIHDELGQALIGLKLDVAYLIRSLDRRPAAAVAKLEQMAARIDETVRAVRRLSAELRPSILDDLGLIAAMEWQLEEFRARTRMECALQSPGTDVALDPDRATALFRIFQEALTNIARHSGATRVQVRLEDSPEQLSLTVQDNGRGVRDEEIARSHSFGVQGIQERVHLLQGHWSIRGVPGQGTTVQVTIPRGTGGPA